MLTRAGKAFSFGNSTSTSAIWTGYRRRTIRSNSRNVKTIVSNRQRQKTTASTQPYQQRLNDLFLKCRNELNLWLTEPREIPVSFFVVCNVANQLCFLGACFVLIRRRCNSFHCLTSTVLSFILLFVQSSLKVPRWISPRRITFRISECFGHASFFLVAVSYAVDDFLQLRLLAIAGSSAMLVFTYFHVRIGLTVGLPIFYRSLTKAFSRLDQPHGRVLWLPFKWNCVFVLLNSWRVARVYIDRFRSGQLSKSICDIYENHFYVTEKTDFARLVRLGTIEKFKKGDVIVQQDHDNRYVSLVISGDCSVNRDGQTTYWLHPGQFISEMGLHAGLGLRGSVKSCCSVIAESNDGVELVRWDRTELMRLLEFHKSIEQALKAVMSWDIVSKLKSQRVLLASGHIDDPERWTLKRREQSLARYKAILCNMLKHPNYLNARKDELAKYREIHQVSYSDHVSALHDIGWTVEEFDSGIKEGQLDEDEIEKQMLGLKWWFVSWWKAL